MSKIRVPTERVGSIRYPETIFTTAYLNDPVRFETDERFTITSAVRDAELFEAVTRDQAEFVVVDLAKETGQFYTVEMYRADYDRGDFERIIDKKRRIRQLLG